MLHGETESINRSGHVWEAVREELCPIWRDSEGNVKYRLIIVEKQENTVVWVVLYISIDMYWVV